VIRLHAHIGFWGSVIGLLVSMDRPPPDPFAWIFAVATGVYWALLVVAGNRRDED
jgi:threonine/homoserine efflux transporter RhtA